MGSYVGAVTLLDEADATLAEVRASISSADPQGDTWFGYVDSPDLVIDLTGRDVVVELPSGGRGRATVQIDLTKDQPVARLVGRGHSPI